MVVTGTVPKNQLYQAICDAIVSPGSNWTQISSNTTEDYSFNGSDGMIFKSPPIGVNNQSVIFRIKQQADAWGSQIGSLRLGLYVNIMKDYTPGLNGKNGTMTGQSFANMHTNAFAFDVIDPMEPFKYYVLIENHRIIILYWKDMYDNGSHNKSMLYIGYPDLTTNFEIQGVTNNIFIITNGTYNCTQYNYINVMLENGTTTNFVASNSYQTNYWSGGNSYDPDTNSFILYPTPIEKVGQQPGIVFQGYMDGVYHLFMVGSGQIQDLDIISDGVNTYLVLGVGIGFYITNYYQAVRLS